MDIETELYLTRKTAPLWWFNKSSDLHASAGALWLSMENENSQRIVTQLGLGRGFSMAVAAWPVYQMLCGLSLELIYKAIMVAKNEEPPAIHLLEQLADMAKVNLTEIQRGILRVLSESVIWDGKYPVPKNHNTYLKARVEKADLLFDEVQGTIFKRPNHLLDWDSYNKLWAGASELFFQREASLS